MTRDVMLNAFLPASEIEDPFRFAGRAKQVKDLTDSLGIVRSVPLVHGDRGLGKSSLAVQLTRIAKGDVDLLAELDLKRLALKEHERFIAFYVTCSDATEDFEGLLQAMINAIETLMFEQARGDRYELVDRTTRKSVSMDAFTLEVVDRYKAAADKVNTQAFTLSERLVYLAECLTDAYQQPVLFVIDEIDRIAPVPGLASFLKSHSSAVLKFVLVGIGTTVSGLLADHGSLDRQLIPVELGPMEEEELASIVERVEEYLHENGEAVEFSQEATDLLAQSAGGFPWFVHVIGQAALIEADDEGREEVLEQHVLDAITSLAGNRFAAHYSTLYQRAVRDSKPREIVLRLCARWPAQDIPTSQIYPKARELGVPGASTYMGHLAQDQHGRVVVRSARQDRALYTFPDAMFKVYVRLRPSLAEGVKADVDKAMRGVRRQRTAN